MRVAGMAFGPVEAPHWGTRDRAADFFDASGDVEALLAPVKAVFEPAVHPAMHPGRCARVLVDGVGIGFVGELHPKWRQSYDLATAPVMFELDLDAVLQRPVPVFRPVTKHQPVQRDIAVLVAEQVTHAALMAAIWSAPTQGLLQDATLFDVYRPRQQADHATVVATHPTEKSLAVRLTLNSDDATLTEQQIDAAVQAVVAGLAASIGARQRV
jgi:phenylalanyl-tRNA synthetase beta chain